LVVIAGCDDGRRAGDAGVGERNDAGTGTDTGTIDAGRVDAGSARDAGTASDGGASDVGAAVDTGASDVGSAVDASAPVDALVSVDAFVSVDAGHDAFVATGGCVSGAVGTRAVRFAWRGSGPGSTAYVDYEANELPDTSRWHVSAASTSFSYTPVFDDTFLGPGGLDLESPAFVDVELSTLGLGSVSSVTIAIYGRSFDTTASGSFSWQTFSGTGAAPTNLVANSTPYEWYLADATSELPAGDGGTLLRIYPGPSSNALIVNRVEICFAE
jgi:hypothetical protein